MLRRILASLWWALVPALALSQSASERLSAIHEHAAELLDGGRVLVVTLAPAREDLSIAAYYRSVQRAQVRVVYLTNGEATIADGSIQYPHQVAADLRRIAATSAEQLASEATFLNLPHLDGVSADSILPMIWPEDSLRAGLRRELEEFQPDLVLLDALDRPEVAPAIRSYLRAVLLDQLSRARRMRRATPSVVAEGSTAIRGVRDRMTRSKDGATRRAAIRAATLDSLYDSWRLAVPFLDRTFTTIPPYPADRRRNVSDLRSLLRRPVPPSLAPLDSQIRAYARDVRLWRRLPSGKEMSAALQRPVLLLGQIDRTVRTVAPDEELERRTLLDWRASLEDLRVQLLGAKVHWRVSDSVLTNLQVSFITIDSVRGLDPQGQTQLFFPMVQRGWILNEGTSHIASYSPGVQHRIISGRSIAHDLPRELVGLQQHRYRTPWYFFLVHQATQPDRSFSIRLDAGFLGAPRFSVDVLWPIAMVAAGEELVVRLTNNSRDGVRDTLRIEEAQVRSTPMFFRLNAKGSSEIDTLALRFSDDLPWGTHLGALSIAGHDVGRFMYRRFPFAVDSSKAVGLFGAARNSVGSKVLRRLGAQANGLASGADASWELADTDVVLIPEWSGQGIRPEGWGRLRSFVERGGHLVALAQHAEVLQRLPQSPIRDAVPDGRTDSSSTLTIREGSPLSSVPNDLSDESWEGWLNRRVPHRLTLRPEEVETLAAVGPDEIPAIVQWKVGRGRITYVNLNLQHQFLNVLPAAYRLLANVLAL